MDKQNRRDRVSFDPRYFEKRSGRDEDRDLQATFSEIYRRDHWAGRESVSGEGSDSKQTVELKTELPPLLEQLEITTLLDLPCGDLNWIGEITLPVDHYIGGDIVPELIDNNRTRYAGSSTRTFCVLDLTADPLPPADLLLCRDCLVHFSFKDIRNALENIRNSSIRWLLTTTFTNHRENEDICTGDWRMLNLQGPPFGFSPPERLIVEQCTEGDGAFRDKSLGLWLVDELPPI